MKKTEKLKQKEIEIIQGVENQLPNQLNASWILIYILREIFEDSTPIKQN